MPSNQTSKPTFNSSPRVWSGFLLLAMVFLSAILLQSMLAVFLIVTQIESGENLAEQLQNLILKPGLFILNATCGQIPILFGAIVAARMSPVSFRERLKLRAPSWPTSRYLLFALGTLVPTAIGVALAIGLGSFLPADDSVDKLYGNMTWGWALPFIVFISIVPGIGEEFLFRGYVQGRFLKRFPPLIAIFTTSILFSLFHVSPHAIVFTFPIGSWLGVLAWKTDSVWPGVVCHAFLNGVWNIFQIGIQLTNASNTTMNAILGILAVVGGVAFIFCAKYLLKTPCRESFSLPSLS